jgi:hypothetical protein
MDADELEMIYKVLENGELLTVDPAGPNAPGKFRVRASFTLTPEQMKLFLDVIT